MKPIEAVAFVERHGVVLQSARGPVPNLAEAVARGPLRGSWWSHRKGKEIFHAAEAVSESPDVLVCKLIEGKVTFVHRRLWPALVKLAGRFRRKQLAKVWNEHTSSGVHRLRQVTFPSWVPAEVMREAAGLSVSEAESILSQWPALFEGRRTGVEEPSDEALQRPSASRRSPGQNGLLAPRAPSRTGARR